MSDLSPNRISKEDKVRMDAMYFQMMDKHTWKSTAFLNFKAEDDDDLTVIPVETKVNWYSAFRKGIGSRYGHN